LASRLPDAAILYGKILAAVLYAIFLALCTLAVGLVTVNTVYPAEEFVFYKASIFWSGVVGGGLISVLGAAVGALVSLRAATVRQAAQTLSYAMLGIFFLPIVLVELAPRWLVRDAIRFFGPVIEQRPLLVTGLILALVVCDIVLLFIARMRFRRTQLMLD
jgi:ABC-2 type transport system permease protein